MANIIRSAKSASDWSPSELKAYRIEMDDVSEVEFFGAPVSELPFETDFLRFENGYDMSDSSSARLAWAMREALTQRGDVEPNVDLFATRLLDFMEYTNNRRQVKWRQDLTFTICGETRSAKADISIVVVPCSHTEGSTILLIEEDKKTGKGEPVQRMIPEAMAAFEHNNNMRRTKHLPPREKQVIPAITLVGTTPTFYLVPITLALMEAVGTGQYPAADTYVRRFKPETVLGMVYLKDRRKVLEYYHAFKRFVDEMEEGVGKD
ncbi:hypothetical protein K439DRAFT_1633774 [Ramaria rubella]|nr:hypothetical protein K439DRAFT_1633774 [Ramaria rubella]